jgi:two-component system chemotaxis response regulator CheB
MIVIGASFGASRTLPLVLGPLTPGFPDAIAVVVHRHRESDQRLVELLQVHCALPVSEAVDKEAFQPGRIYLAPADYHLLVESRHFELSTDEPFNFARPSIDVCFESVAHACGAAAIGVLLTGANADGAVGLAKIKVAGGTIVVQEPTDAECPVMPAAALALVRADYIRSARAIPALLVRLAAEAAQSGPG